MLCPVHVCAPMIYVSRDPVTDEKKKSANRMTAETAEFDLRQAGYYKCTINGCFRVERVPYEDFVAPKQAHNCPACGKISDAPAERIIHHGYRCNACFLLKNMARSRQRKDKIHRKRNLAAGPKASFDSNGETIPRERIG